MKAWKSLYKVRIKILAFVLILLVFGTVNATTRTKFVSYVNAYSVAEAGSFYFGSNFLATSDEDLTYTISNWSKNKYSVTIQIWNYENSLLYNHEDVNFYYKVEAIMYTDEKCTQEDTSFFSTITYASSVDTVDVKITDEDGNEVTETYAYMEGTASFDKADGSQLVSVMMESTSYANDVRYMKITATAMPVIDGEITSTSQADTLNDYEYGVFENILDAVFLLQNTSGSATVSNELSQSNINSQVQLRITCSEIAGGTFQTLRVYYDPDKLEADSLTLPNAVESDIYINGESGTKYYYSEIEVNAESITTVLLLKLYNETITMGTSIDDMADIFVQEVS